MTLNSVGLLIVGVVVLIVLYFIPTMPSPLRIVLSIIGWCCVAIGGILILLGILGVATSTSPRLTAAFYALQTAVDRPGAVPSNPMDANAIALIGVPVVALTQLAKWANLPDAWGPAAVLLFALVGIAVWVASYGGFHQGDLFNYFVAWITTAVASAGVFGFTRASASAVTAIRPPSAAAAGGNPTTP